MFKVHEQISVINFYLSVHSFISESGWTQITLYLGWPPFWAFAVLRQQAEIKSTVTPMSNHYTMKAYRVMEVKCHAFITLALDGSGQLYVAAALPMGKAASAIRLQAEWAPESVWVRWQRKSVPVRNWIPVIQSKVSLFTNCSYSTETMVTNLI
jgi:hypothetical protein